MKHASQFLVVLAAAFAMVAAEEEEVDPAVKLTNISMAGTLFCSVVFVMILYYFTNYPDADIQENSWNIISSLISIFSAVLIFQSLNAFVEELIINPLFGKEEATPGALFVDMCHMLVWYSFMQAALARISGAFYDDWLNEKYGRPKVGDSERKKEIKWEKRNAKKTTIELNCQCWSVLLAHMTGFASINAWGTVQQFGFFKQGAFHALLAVPIAIVGQLVLQRISDTIRYKLSLSDVDEHGQAEVSWFEKKWDSEAEEAENDVMGLTVSFLLMNTIRLAINGCLPNQEGAEEECKVEEFLFNHTFGQKLAMLLVIALSAVAIFCLLFFVPMAEEEEEEEKCIGEEEEKEEEEEGGFISEETKGRFIMCIAVAVSMLFSWSFFYGLQMILAGIPALKGMDELLSVTLAMAVSIVSFALLVALDYLADQDSGEVVSKYPNLFKNQLAKYSEKEVADKFDEKIDKGIRQIMVAIGLAVGFAWEQCFDKSVDSIAEATEDSKFFLVNPATTKVALAIGCAGLLVPAWRMYILPFVHQKGWQFGWTVNLVDKYCNHIEETDNDEIVEEAAVVIKKKLKKATKDIEQLIRDMKDMKVSDEDIKKERKLTEGGQEFESTKKTAKRVINEKLAEEGYIKMAGDENGALKKEVNDLKTQLNAYRRMFDDHMKNMGGNLRKMNDTMNKLQVGP